MRRLLALLFTLLALAGPAGALQAAGGPIIVTEIRGPLVPVTADALDRVLDLARERDAEIVILELDTPGGLVTTVREMVAAMLECTVPVVVHVTPSGASAASGGVFLVLAADVAAMSPVSDMGAAHPVFVGQENNPDDIMLTKAENELAAFARSLAENRGRNPEEVELMVRDSLSYSAQEAIQAGFVDLLAANRSELLTWLDGRDITRYDGEVITVSVTGRSVEFVERNLRERVLGVLSNPAVVFFLLAIAGLGLYTEITNPGGLLPGAVGVICLLLFALSSQLLPINWVGVGLIALGLGLLLLELSVVSYGALTVGGLACLVIGALVLFDTPEALRVPRSLLVGVSLSVGLIAVFLVQLAIRAQKTPHATGREALVGMRGEAITPLHPEGKVLVRGEYYDAHSDGSVDKGGTVVVLAMDGRRLRVRPEEKEVSA